MLGAYRYNITVIMRSVDVTILSCPYMCRGVAVVYRLVRQGVSRGLSLGRSRVIARFN